MLGHIFDVVVVFDQSIGVDSLLISCSETTCKNSGIFFIKKDENTGETDFLSGVLPKTFITISLWKVLHNSEFSPVAETVLIFPETLSANTVTQCDPTDGRDPGTRYSRVKLFVVVGFERKPATEDLLGVPEFDTL